MEAGGYETTASGTEAQFVEIITEKMESAEAIVPIVVEAATEEIAAEPEIPVITETEVKEEEPPVIADTTPTELVVSEPKKVSILVLDAFEEWRDFIYNDIETYWDGKEGSNTKTTVDYEVKVEDLLAIGDYDIVTFSMHGSYMRIGATYYPVMCLLDDVRTVERTKELAGYLAKNELAIFNSASGASFYAVLPSFWANELKDNSLENTYIVSETCDFFGWCSSSECNREENLYCNNVRTDFGVALNAKGAISVTGMHNSVMMMYSLDYMSSFINILLAGYTPEIAYGACLEYYGLTDAKQRPSMGGTPAYPLLMGSDLTKTLGEEKEIDLEENHKAVEEANAVLQEQGAKVGAVHEFMLVDEQVAYDRMGWVIRNHYYSGGEHPMFVAPVGDGYQLDIEYYPCSTNGYNEGEGYWYRFSAASTTGELWNGSENVQYNSIQERMAIDEQAQMAYAGWYDNQEYVTTSFTINGYEFVFYGICYADSLNKYAGHIYAKVLVTDTYGETSGYGGSYKGNCMPSAEQFWGFVGISNSEKF